MTYETAFNLALIAAGAGGGCWAMLLKEFTPGLTVKNVVETLVASVCAFSIALAALGTIFR